MSTPLHISRPPRDKSISSPLAVFGQRLALVGFILYAAFAPHSIAGAEISLVFVGAGWLLRTIASRQPGTRRTKLDLPIWCFFAWTVASSLLSEEPGISLRKLQSVCVLFLFYLTQAIVTRRAAFLLVCVMILSGVAGTLNSLFDVLRGRGVVVESIADDSPLQQMHVAPGDAIWRINERRIHSLAELDRAIQDAPAGSNLTVSLISRGEHVERRGLVPAGEVKNRESPSGITGSHRAHRFRASGWTRHYETFAETLQILALLALGLALAHLKNHGPNLRFKLAITASSLLGVGIALTAMRTVLVAFGIGVCVIVLRASRGKELVLVPAALILVLALGAFVVWQTRAPEALALGDASSSLRLAVARAGAHRITQHPVFGHGMDAVHRHWSEWGFPGTEMIGLHSTPLQLAFDRGLPGLALWLWLIATFWLLTTRGERAARERTDTDTHGILLGATGALAAFLASSLVNYNFGDGEVALVFWWLMGIVVVLFETQQPRQARD